MTVVQCLLDAASVTPEQEQAAFDAGYAAGAALTDDQLLAIAEWAATRRDDLDAGRVEPPAALAGEHPHGHEAA